ncbi:hypothetical protein [Brevundimonas sp.]
MRTLAVLAVAAVLSSATVVLAQTGLPAVTDAETRAQMNAEIVQAITAADGDQAAARSGVSAIVTRYQEAAESQAARTRPRPK